jgi:hypothetical protein
MTAIGKLFALVTLVAGLALLTWSVNLYVHRPGWFAEPPLEGVDKGSRPVGFPQMKKETEALYRSAAVASEAWGTHLRALEQREEYRANRKRQYALRIQWAHKGNPRDPIDATNPKSPGKGFYEHVVDPATRLYDLTVDAKTGLPRGKPVVGTEGLPLPGLDGLLDSIADDTKASVALNEEILKQEAEFDRLDKLVIDTEIRAIKMGVIRDSVQAEVFFLSTFEVNVFETRETVFRRERQLRGRLRGLGIQDP